LIARGIKGPCHNRTDKRQTGEKLGIREKAADKGTDE